MYDVIIIGAGPAGMSAGIYTCRKKLTTLILSPDIGGQTAKSWDVENYLGFHLIQGADLSAKFKEHLDGFECVDLKVGVEVVRLKKTKEGFEVELKKGDKYQGKTVIIASGKNPRHLNVEGETDFRGKGVTYCATCDAPLFKDKVVAVVGDGNSALDATYQLTKIAKKIYLFVIKDKFRKDLDKVLLENATKPEHVEVIFDASVIQVFGDKFVNAVEYEDVVTKKRNKLELKGVFIEIGSIPSVDFCKDFVELNKWNEIKIDAKNMTSVEGVFAAGDVTEVVEKQTIIAAGEGAKAAIGVANYLSRKK